MTSLLDAQPDVLGAQEPRVGVWPAYSTTTGEEVVELCEMAGLSLDPWQQLVIRHGLGERDDGKWAAPDVGVVVARQNGKGGIIEARELAGLFLLDERLITHSAHLFDTSMEAFRRLCDLIENTPALTKRCKKPVRSHGQEGIETLDGKHRIRFRTRTKGGGRGFAGDCLILDEAMELPEATLSALLPTLSARPNPQVWYLGSAVDQEIHENGIVFARVRERGHAGDDPMLAYFEWSADVDPSQVDPDVVSDPALWAASNPALGIRINVESIQRERASMSARAFAVERLSAGDWPSTAEAGIRMIPTEMWRACEYPPDDQRLDPMVFALDVTPDRRKSVISAAGRLPNGKIHVEAIENRKGTDWVYDRLSELVETWKPKTILYDTVGPAASLVAAEPSSRVRSLLTPLGTGDVARACGSFVDGVLNGTLQHIGQTDLDVAVDGATTRKMGDAWAWNRKDSSVDISPLVAVTFAHWGIHTIQPKRPRIINLNDID